MGLRACVLHESTYSNPYRRNFPPLEGAKFERSCGLMVMERTLWTDKRIDDVVERIERRFDEVDRRFDRLEADIAELRREMHNQFVVTTGAILGLAGVVLANSF